MSALTMKEAKAIVACKNKIDSAINICLEKLGTKERQYAEAYWASHVRRAFDGSYGSAPVDRALDVIEGITP